MISKDFVVNGVIDGHEYTFDTNALICAMEDEEDKCLIEAHRQALLLFAVARAEERRTKVFLKRAYLVAEATPRQAKQAGAKITEAMIEAEVLTSEPYKKREEEHLFILERAEELQAVADLLRTMLVTKGKQL